MRVRAPKNAIVIGDSEWIDRIDLTGRHESAVNIDSLIEELEPVWGKLETECEAGCCGISAFNFRPESIALAATRLNAPDVVRKIETLLTQLRDLNTQTLVSERMNNYFDAREFTAVLNHLQKNFSIQRQ